MNVQQGMQQSSEHLLGILASMFLPRSNNYNNYPLDVEGGRSCEALRQVAYAGSLQGRIVLPRLLRGIPMFFPTMRATMRRS